jgi:hypothetical protein
MAYTPKMFGKDQEDEQVQLGMGGTPALGSSGMGVGTGSMGGGTGTPQAQAAPSAPSSLGAGTGFVNIDRMIGANQGIGSHVSSFGKSTLEKEGEAFKKEQDKTTSAIYEGGSKIPTMESVDTAIGGLVAPPTAPGKSSSPIAGGPAPNAGAQEAIMGALGAQYTGPMGMTYNIGKTGGIKSANALASGKATGREIASQTGTMAGYNPQMSAIDAALYGQVGDAVAARDALTKSTKDTVAKQGLAADSVAASARGEADRAREIREGTAGKLRDLAGGIISGAETQAQQNTGQGLSLTRENFIDPRQAENLSFISRALGDPSLAVGSSPRDSMADAATRSSYRQDIAGANVLRQPNAPLPAAVDPESVAQAEAFIRSPAANTLPPHILQALTDRVKGAADAHNERRRIAGTIGSTR